MTISFTVAPGEDPKRAWMRHEVAALSEGLCPKCAGRMLPANTPEGAGALCPRHGYWHVSTDLGQITWWLGYDPFTGRPAW